MKKIVLLAVLIFASLPCFAKKEDVPEVKLQSIFLTDTSEAEDYIEPEDIPLKGYAEYIEDSEAIYLTDENDQFVLNLKVPQKITTKKLSDENDTFFKKKPVFYSKYGSEEYHVIPKDGDSTIQNGDIAFGTAVGQEVDIGELEHTATLFTQYKKGRFAVKTAYERTIGSTYNNYFDNFYIAPELKVNKYLSIKEVLTADITRNRKKAEVVLSLSPLAKTKENRLNLELGASQTYDATNALIRKQIKFNTRFKL